MALMDWPKTTARRDRNLLSFVISCLLYKVFYGISGRQHNVSIGGFTSWNVYKDLCFGDAFLTQEEHTWW